MRMLLKLSMDVEKFNEAAQNGTAGKTITGIIQEQKPEAAYFSLDQGMRTAFIVVNMEHASELPKFCEPWFLAFNAEIEAQPAMVPTDLTEKAGPYIQQAVEKYT